VNGEVLGLWKLSTHKQKKQYLLKDSPLFLAGLFNQLMIAISIKAAAFINYLFNTFLRIIPFSQ
ncbi:hypothetical protein Q0590_33445, partial [Rhodocytophaga aerolata]